MKAAKPNPGDDLARHATFTTTHWSVILAASQAESPAAAEALETLCRTYWYPLYVYVRRRGHDPGDAEDLTQGFFAHLLSQDFLRGVGPEKGRFRSFLLACLSNILCDDWDCSHAAKRGLGQSPLSLDADETEKRYRREAVDGLTPEVAYERRWAATLLERAQTRLAGEYARHGKADLLRRLQAFPHGERHGFWFLSSEGVFLEPKEAKGQVVSHILKDLLKIVTPVPFDQADQ